MEVSQASSMGKRADSHVPTSTWKEAGGFEKPNDINEVWNFYSNSQARGYCCSPKRPPKKWLFVKGLVPVERIELPTFGLQNRCSTAELNRQTGSAKSAL